MDNKVARQAMAENGGKWKIMAGNGRKWLKMDFRGKMAGNGFPRVSRRGHRGGQAGNGRNGRKWQKMDFRGKMAGNGFSRFLRQSPTTDEFVLW